jgi:hypothetical protein
MTRYVDPYWGGVAGGNPPPRKQDPRHGEAPAGSAIVVLGSAAVLAVDLLRNPWFNDVAWAAAIPAAWALLAVLRRAWSTVGLCAVLAGGWAWTARPPEGPSPLQVLVVGVDGGTFDVIDAEAARLPTFQRLALEGARGPLRSMEPMFSPLLWTTLASGRVPGDHGVRGFRVHAEDCRTARVWDVAEDAGMRVGVWKWLVDYPPRVVPGFWVPSWLAPGPETWPVRLSAVKELELAHRTRRAAVAPSRGMLAIGWDLVGLGMRLSTLADGAAWWAERKAYAFVVRSVDAARADVRNQLLRGRIDRDVFVAQVHREEVQFATFTFYGVDALGHLYWDRHEAGGDEVRAAYREADAILAELWAQLGPEGRLIVVSDHGFQSMATATGANGPAGRFLPKTEALRARLLRDFPGAAADVTRVGHKITLSTRDIAAQTLRVWVGRLVDSAGNPFYRVEELDGDMLGLTLADEQVDARRLASDTVGGAPLSDYVALDRAYTGTHAARGILYVAGPGVQAGATLPEAGLLDVAPTVLGAAGLATSTEMMGRSVVPAWKGPAPVRSWDGLLRGHRWLGGESGVAEPQMRALGYIE